MRTMSLVRWAPLALLLVAPLAYGQNDPNQSTPSDQSANASAGKLSDADAQLLAHYHDVAQAQISLSQMASKQAKSSAVKNYAKQVVDDAKSTDRQLQAFAKRHNTKIPKASAATDTEQSQQKDMQDMMNRLKSMKGAEFDREYLLTQVADIDRETSMIDANAGKAQNTELAQMIRDMKPVMQRHADMARDLQQQMTQQPGQQGQGQQAQPPQGQSQGGMQGQGQNPSSNDSSSGGEMPQQHKQ